MVIILAGTIGRSGLGGQGWANLQYLLGLRALGHDVWYLEDCGDTSWVWDWEKQEWNYDLDYPAGCVQSCLAPFGLSDRWLYRTDAGCCGMGLDHFKSVCAQADLLIMRATPLWVWRKEYELPRRRAFIDVDPGFTQIALANGDKGLAQGISRCERRFTIAQRIGAADCSIPLEGGPWLKTLPPVFLPEWPISAVRATHFTSVIRWQGFREASFGGRTYGQRDMEFKRYLDLPSRSGEKFRLALMGVEPSELARHGWEVVPGETASRTPTAYREFIQGSRGELAIPKHGYVAMRGGWFSDRSVCYLASGRPVLMADTGLDWLATGQGVVTFQDIDSAVQGVRSMGKNYAAHCHAARQLAESVFATGKVLPELLQAAMS